MTTIHVGEFRTPIRVGDKYVLKPGSSGYWLYATVTEVHPDFVRYDFAAPYAEPKPVAYGAFLTPVDFARQYIWDACASKINA